jgi:hypothetical protein
MSSNQTNVVVKSSGGGIGFMGVLFITFLVLRLTEVIDWSWWWVTAPLWGVPALIIGFILGIIAIVLGLILIILPFLGLGYLIYWIVKKCKGGN